MDIRTAKYTFQASNQTANDVIFLLAVVVGDRME